MKRAVVFTLIVAAIVAIPAARLAPNIAILFWIASIIFAISAAVIAMRARRKSPQKN